MTSGTSGSTALGGQQFAGFGDYKLWNGADGKTEVLPGGTKRPRWNNYSMTRAYRKRPINYWTATAKNGGAQFNVLANVSFLLTKPVAPAGLLVQAQSRLTDKVRGHSFNLAVNAAQGRQLVDMVTSNLGKFGRSVLALKHGDFATAARALGARPRVSKLRASDISGRWLELQYGWLPALSDTYEAAKAYEKITEKPRTSTVRSSAKITFKRNAHIGSFANAFQTCVQRISYVWEMYEDISTPRSLGLLDPLSVAWEVLPYSFVVDWFVPIGSYLDNLSILPFVKGRLMTQQTWEWSGSEPLTFTDPLPGFFGGTLCSKVEYLGVDECRAILIERGISASLPSVAFPSFDSHGLRGRRVWNAIALAAQRFL